MWLFVYIHHVGNFTTNLAECWMHIRTKFDGGKQINRCQGSAWNARCAGATLRQNFGPNWGPKSWESIMTADANQVYISISEERCKLAEVDRKRKATDNADGKVSVKMWIIQQRQEEIMLVMMEEPV